ncbi:hypothetical protein EBL87_04185 [Cereibacter sphaeroides]|uniref:ATP-binding protein n=1 Tax=Cereibacter sphaeroides TaxID=1063 RepID=UPI000F521736|nr:ATP-binding protein [Cereibacter sphaeroides]AZB62968.1 hypothetical protein EBL87_04185 [Cereibacter sphaeroides]AZB69070.1 hypothetical protein EBL86_12190 [Cereibacter sphaeroides]
MKKLSRRYKAILVYRAVRVHRLRSKRAGAIHRYRGRARSADLTFEPFEVSIWDGRSERRALCTKRPLVPPANLNLDLNIDETLKFLKDIRDRIGKKRSPGQPKGEWLSQKPGRMPRIGSFYDFAKIETISISAALILASCYDRARRISGATPPAVNYADWPMAVFRVLQDVGFFEFIGHVDLDASGIPTHQDQSDERRICSAISGKNANGLEQCSNEIFQLLLFLSVDSENAEQLLADINSAVSEAMINVARHAYPSDFVAASIYDTVGQWWFAAQADRPSRELKIVVYDQGATIPGTLPRREWFKSTVESVMRSVVPDFIYDRDKNQRIGSLDHEYINYSMRRGKTQTNDPERGLGLPQMQSLVDHCSDGSISIVSRSGLYRYAKGTSTMMRALPVDLEGTLVEWRLSLPAEASANE